VGVAPNWSSASTRRLSTLPDLRYNIVFHTGPAPWRTSRTLAELIGGPEEVRVYAPEWSPLFLDVAEHSAEEWLQSAGEWMAAMAVVRAERAEAETFRQVFIAVLKRWERLSRTEGVRWHDLVYFLLSWGLRRRPGREQQGLLTAAQESQTDAQRREEMRKMSEVIEKTWEQEIWEEAHTQGQLREARTMLRSVLEDRFGPLPAALIDQIEQSEEIDLLRAATRRAYLLGDLEELEL